MLTLQGVLMEDYEFRAIGNCTLLREDVLSWQLLLEEVPWSGCALRASARTGKAAMLEGESVSSPEHSAGNLNIHCSSGEKSKE